MLRRCCSGKRAPLVSSSILMLVSKVEKQREQDQRPLLERLIRLYLSSFLGGFGPWEDLALFSKHSLMELYNSSPFYALTTQRQLPLLPHINPKHHLHSHSRQLLKREPPSLYHKIALSRLLYRYQVLATCDWLKFEPFHFCTLK